MVEMNKKQLQNLFSWSEFYRKNDRFLDLEKTQKQINNYINKLKKNDK